MKKLKNTYRMRKELAKMLDPDMIPFNRPGYVNGLKHVEHADQYVDEGRSWKDKRDEQFKDVEAWK